MKDKIFIDTNILLYAYSTEKNKQEIAQNIINTNNNIYISKQVINETINILIKKFKLNIKDIINVVKELEKEFIILDFDIQIQLNALKLKQNYNLQFYDALIVSTALKNSCTILYSEDMQDKLVIEKKLKIINPF
ncbi:PIN domain-containing protein [Aliarcobacter cryaerophilus]|mgnify:FL=1|jgi:predicted nucleic acid-binding protein|uniref:PIN domain-containing protein n=1 Tax=Arcobacter sp. AZ-2023 TaxID=3074453 RepID=A0AA96DQ89_9BACT|nr:PIN domain-containing protein [Aliarcobacter cryaerophilus]WNL29498.1 PIN domain-containing protein [Arcobacter sp. AZ-2023]MCT7406170.1 PIN domain-containing protein [Aliarcobacter cryaerophilus]MCT7465324.1 PIN domain-containing protein [Aliarcobacter cryaerophilus]MCT7496648.1 PIN domain-containing protein [Aliarcobacter cryaerophilus]MCT7503863.1 PIN domain-containing protein [Aliarcobacter cryaerophilus]